MTDVKNSYPKLHSYRLKGAKNVERIPVYHKTKEDNPYVVLAEVMNIDNIKNVTISYWVGDKEFNYRTTRNLTSGAVYDFQTGILKAMGVI